MKKTFLLLFVFLFFIVFMANAAKTESVNFEDSQIIDGKRVFLNGISLKKAFVFVKVYMGALYLENKTHDAKKIIESEQIKQMRLHYLTDKATSSKIKEGFRELMEKANSKELIEKQKENLEKHISWLDIDMKPNFISTTTYIPNKGLVFAINGVEKGVIKDKEYAKMYFNYCVGKNAEEKIRDGYLGVK